MEYLIDTHAFLWYIDGKQDLSVKSREIMLNRDLIKYVSIASLWEIAIKSGKDKLLLTRAFKTLPEYIYVNGFNTLPIQPKHLFLLKELPHHHSDPFDRLLIAQAISESLTIISVDKQFQNYSVPVIW